jgi:hypothetical protein
MANAWTYLTYYPQLTGVFKLILQWCFRQI